MRWISWRKAAPDRRQFADVPCWTFWGRIYGRLAPAGRLSRWVTWRPCTIVRNGSDCCGSTLASVTTRHLIPVFFFWFLVRLSRLAIDLRAFVSSMIRSCASSDSDSLQTKGKIKFRSTEREIERYLVVYSHLPLLSLFLSLTISFLHLIFHLSILARFNRNVPSNGLPVSLPLFSIWFDRKADWRTGPGRQLHFYNWLNLNTHVTTSLTMSSSTTTTTTTTFGLLQSRRRGIFTKFKETSKWSPFRRRPHRHPVSPARCRRVQEVDGRRLDASHIRLAIRRWRPARTILTIFLPSSYRGGLNGPAPTTDNDFLPRPIRQPPWLGRPSVHDWPLRLLRIRQQPKWSPDRLFQPVWIN